MNKLCFNVDISGDNIGWLKNNKRNSQGGTYRNSRNKYKALGAVSEVKSMTLLVSLGMGKWGGVDTDGGYVMVIFMVSK